MFNIEKKKRNYTVNLLRKENKIYFNNLRSKNLTDNKGNKQLRRNVKRLLSDKISESSKITLVNNNRIASDDREICDLFYNFFVNVVHNLKFSKFTGSDINYREHIIGDYLFKQFCVSIKVIQVSSKLRRTVNLVRNLSSVSYQKMKSELSLMFFYFNQLKSS